MFKFEFDLDDLSVTDELNGEQIAAVPPSSNTTLSGTQSDRKPHPDNPCTPIPISELILQLPPFISYSDFKINHEISIYKRELYDAKYQTIVNLVEEEEAEGEGEGEKEEKKKTKTSDRTLSSLQSTSDLIPGVYEGGFKTWECSLDLATNLGPIIERLKVHFLNNLQNHAQDSNPRRTFTILELGCGTAIPTASLCFQLFRHLLTLNRHQASGQAEKVNDGLNSNDLDSDNQEPPILEIILQDFNSDVLKLLTFPNILLAFYRAKEETAKKDGITGSEESELNKERMDGEQEEESNLETTDELKTDMISFLNMNRIRLTMISGAWSTFKVPGTSTTGSSDESLRRSCDVIMSSETLYSIDSIPDFINVLINCKDQDSTILVASKSLYFGVGGGTHAFVKALQKFNGLVSYHDIHNNNNLCNSSGVSRVLMDVKFAS